MFGEDLPRSSSRVGFLDPEGTIPVRLALAFWRMKISLERELDVGLGAWFLLNRLRVEDGMSQGELCRRNDFDPSRITRLAQRLERDGLVRRGRDPEDNRVVRMYLTGAGLSFIEERDQRYRAFVETIEESLGEESAEDFGGSLLALEENLRGYGKANRVE